MRDSIGEPAGGLLESFRRARTPRGREAAGRFLIEGTRLHERAMRSGAGPEHTLVVEELLGGAGSRERRLLDELERTSTVVHLVPAATLLEFTEGRSLGPFVGLVASGAAPELSQILDGPPPRALLVGVEIEEPGNVGALLRTALAVGAAGFVAVGLTDPWHPKAVRTSMGAVFKLPILRRHDADSWLREIADHQVTSIAAVARAGTLLFGASLDRPRLALHVGSEAFGLPRELIEAADERVSIPMSDAVDSLSVNAAAAILLHEVLRRPS